MLNESFFLSLVWITYEWYDPKWWTSSSGKCEDEQMEKALKRMLIVSHHPTLEEFLEVCINRFFIVVYSLSSLC